MHGYVSPDGFIRPCCSTDPVTSVIGRLEDSTLDGAMRKSPLARQMRMQMMIEERPEVCKQCYATDDGGGYSYREWAVKQWGHLRSEMESTTSMNGAIDSFRMRYMDVRPSNLCNLMCKTCSPEFSSALAASARRMEGYAYQGPVLMRADERSRQPLTEQLMAHLDTVEEIYFAGGEPLLMDEHVVLLEELVRRNRTDVTVRYSTNMTMMDRTTVLDLWRRFRTVKVVASVDSWGQRAEYIRQGCDWGKVEDNLLVVRRDAPNVFLTINSVVSIFNFLTMREFWLGLYDRGILLDDSYGSSWTKLYYAPMFRANMLPRQQRRDGILSIEELANSLRDLGRYCDAHMEGFRDYLDMWEHDDIDAGDTVSTIAQLDRHYGVRCHDVFPELAGFLDSNGYH